MKEWRNWYTLKKDDKSKAIIINRVDGYKQDDTGSSPVSFTLRNGIINYSSGSVRNYRSDFKHSNDRQFNRH